MLIRLVKRLTEKVKAKFKSMLAVILPKSACLHATTTSTTTQPTRSRNTMILSPSRTPLPQSTLTPEIPGPPSTDASGADNAVHNFRRRALPTQHNVSTPPVCRVRVPRRPSSPTSSPAHYRRNVSLSVREHKLVQQRRAVTHESNRCRATLVQQGIGVRDFQAGVDENQRNIGGKGSRNEENERKKVALPNAHGGGKGDQWQKPDIDVISEVMEVEEDSGIKGRKIAGTHRGNDGHQQKTC